MPKRKQIAIALTASLLATPAAAHCFSIWHYRYPQRCPVVEHDDHVWSVEIVRLPDDIMRAEAIEKLEGLLK